MDESQMPMLSEKSQIFKITYCMIVFNMTFLGKVKL